MTKRKGARRPLSHERRLLRELVRATGRRVSLRRCDTLGFRSGTVDHVCDPTTRETLLLLFVHPGELEVWRCGLRRVDERVDESERGRRLALASPSLVEELGRLIDAARRRRRYARERDAA